MGKSNIILISLFIIIFNSCCLLFFPSFIIYTFLLILNSLYLNLLSVVIVKNKFILIMSLTVNNLFFGTFGFYVLSGFEASFIDTFYMTIITLSTVGFTEVITTGDLNLIRFFTIYIILMGLGNLLLVLSGISNYLIEGKLQVIFERRLFMSKIDEFNQHILICGGGMTAEHIISELLQTNRDFVVIEKSEERCSVLKDKFPTSIVYHGDATEDDVLLDVGIKKCSSLVAILPLDKDNLFLTITSNHLNKDCRVVSKALNIENKLKLIRAGASSVVPHRYIGALRLVSEVVSPNVVYFLDTMMRTGKHRVVDIPVEVGSKYCGQTIADLHNKSDISCQVISYRYYDDSHFNYNPKHSDVIKENMILFFIMDPIQRDNVFKEINS